MTLALIIVFSILTGFMVGCRLSKRRFRTISEQRHRIAKLEYEMMRVNRYYLDDIKKEQLELDEMIKIVNQ